MTLDVRMHLRAIVGRNVRRQRESLGLTQEEVALAAGIDTKYFGQIERGQRNPSLKKLENIAAAMAIPEDKLFIFE